MESFKTGKYDAKDIIMCTVPLQHFHNNVTIIITFVVVVVAAAAADAAAVLPLDF